MSVSIHAWSGDRHITSSAVADVPGLLASGATVWIDAEGGNDGLSRFLAEVLKLHPLAIEDILETETTPKVEDYGDYLYVIAHHVEAGADAADLKTIEFDLVLTRQWIFTHHREASPCVSAVTTELARNPRALQRGPAFIAHTLLDHLVDAFLPVVDRLDDEVDAVEVAVVEDPTRAVLQRIFQLKRTLQSLRRVAVHQREILQRLSRGEFDEIPAEALPFYRDVFDHFVRVADLADSYRELLSGALDAYLSVVSNRMNEVMKTLTIVATLMMPMTFVAGVYGMNFVNMPELHWKYGYLYAWILLVAIFFGMMGWFKRRRWL